MANPYLWGNLVKGPFDLVGKEEMAVKCCYFVERYHKRFCREENKAVSKGHLKFNSSSLTGYI